MTDTNASETSRRRAADPPAVDLNNGRRFITFLKNANIHKRRRVAGEVPFQYFEPGDVEKLVKVKTARLATEDEIRAAYHADKAGRTYIIPVVDAKAVGTGIAPAGLEDEEAPTDEPAAETKPAVQTGSPLSDGIHNAE